MTANTGVPSLATSLFRPLTIKSLKLKNRFVMAPMTRSFSPGGVPTNDVADYYRRRADGGVGLILSEGTVIARPDSSKDPNIPHFHGTEALNGWKKVIDSVHAAGGKMGPQIWHMGHVPENGVLAGESDVIKTIEAYAQSAKDAVRLGFDTIELHGAHGYLIDQFFYEKTNTRTDQYGGKTIGERTRFASDLLRAVRRAVGPDTTVILRLSQWKPTDYSAKLAATPEEMTAWLEPLVQAGVDVLHCSQRRFWEPEFDGSDLNFAGWAKKITGLPTITVGSVGLSGEFTKAFRGDGSTSVPLDDLIRRFDRGDFDLVAVGRALISDPAWVQKIERGETESLKGFDAADLKSLT